ncbi:AraC family transcriptional regulator [Trinickia violacea]|uniref:AraC family transcriptional regulator n=1 Tax=Trinickia violacea TaxID=2571746 RepID=A0A4P8J4C2_9BURK|nr:AraC family transcriptional regulator [Trinickia violacea]QCP54874.1 AraC family transcriptional regulator [Trinickia violacea]
MNGPPAHRTRSTFWRDASMPFIEARVVHDGRAFCYARHSHETFSIGAVTGGRSTYLNGNRQERVGAGAVVVMNPQDVHACNPVDDQAWAYRMLYVDTQWLTGLQHDMGIGNGRDLTPFATLLTTDAVLYDGLIHLCDTLTDAHADTLHKHSAAIEFFSHVQHELSPVRARETKADASDKVARAAEFLADNCTRTLTLDEICAAAGLSASYLIRAFRKHYGMTPHQYLVNRRIQIGRARLRDGHPIADVAYETGFSDQAHFQRAFKQFLAVTPGQYRS